MTRDDFRNLYQDLLIDHSRERHGYGLREGYLAQSHQVNRSCGDEITLHLHMGPDRIDSVSWTGDGCSISQASASMMTDLVAGATTAEIAERISAFRSMLQSRGKDEGSEKFLGDAVALSGVSKYPPRVNCAMLAWIALEDTLSQLRESPPPDTTKNTQ